LEIPVTSESLLVAIKDVKSPNLELVNSTITGDITNSPIIGLQSGIGSAIYGKDNQAVPNIVRSAGCSFVHPPISSHSLVYTYASPLNYVTIKDSTFHLYNTYGPNSSGSALESKETF
jgi:hypothetical protein